MTAVYSSLMSRKINVGVVGLGYWGPNLARNIHSLDGCHLKAVCDFNEDRLDHFRSNYPLVEQFKEFDAEMLTRESCWFLCGLLRLSVVKECCGGFDVNFTCDPDL